MDSANPTQADLDAELNELRAGLRDYGKRLAVHVQQMGMPETPLQAERTARMVRAADQMLIQVYTPPPPPPRPREARAGATRDSQGHGAHLPDDDEDTEDEDTPDKRKEIAEDIMRTIRGLTRIHAQATGFWPDGQPYDADNTDWQAAAESSLAVSAELPVDADGELSTDGFIALLLRRFNAQTRFQAEKRGFWPNEKPYAPGDPGFWSVTANHQFNEVGPAKGEISGPGYLPNWLVHRPP